MSSHVEVIDEHKTGAAHKSVVQVRAIDGNGDSHGPTTISASRVEVVDGISPIQSYVEHFFSSSSSKFQSVLCLSDPFFVALLLSSGTLDSHTKCGPRPKLATNYIENETTTSIDKK